MQKLLVFSGGSELTFSLLKLLLFVEVLASPSELSLSYNQAVLVQAGEYSKLLIDVLMKKMAWIALGKLFAVLFTIIIIVLSNGFF